jgi:hypothetical protein
MVEWVGPNHFFKVASLLLFHLSLIQSIQSTLINVWSQDASIVQKSHLMVCNLWCLSSILQLGQQDKLRTHFNCSGTLELQLYFWRRCANRCKEQWCFMFYERVCWIDKTWCVSNCHSPVRQRGQHQLPWIMADAEQTSELLLHLTWMWLIAGIKVHFVSLPTLTQFCGLFFQQLCFTFIMSGLLRSRCSQKTQRSTWDWHVLCVVLSSEPWVRSADTVSRKDLNLWTPWASLNIM